TLQARQSVFDVHCCSPLANVPKVHLPVAVSHVPGIGLVTAPWLHIPFAVLHVPDGVQTALRWLVSNPRKAPISQTVSPLVFARISTLTGAPSVTVWDAGFTKTSTACARTGPLRANCKATRTAAKRHSYRVCQSVPLSIPLPRRCRTGAPYVQIPRR